MALSRAGDDFCFVHAADLHLDTPFKGISETAPHVGAALREASLDAFDSLVDLCLSRRAAFLVLAGDLYDGPERGLRAQLRLLDGLRRLSDAGIATFIVHGNHDPVEEGWSAVQTWPDLVHVFGHDAVAAVPVERDGRVLATVQGISYERREVTENLALGFVRQAGEGLQVAVLHCNVAGAPDGHAPYSPCTLEDLRGVGLDYWALGHVHSRSVLSGAPGGSESWVVYPGNLQARSPKPSELGEKGATVVEVRSGRVASLEAVPCDRVRFVLLELDVSALEAVIEVRSQLAEAAAERLERAGGRSLVVRARLVGRSPAHEELRRDGVLDDLLTSLRDEAGPSTPFLWWDRIDDVCLPSLDVEQLRRGDDFAAELVAVADELSEVGIGEAELGEILGKVPREVARLAAGLLEEQGASAVLIEQSVIAALDRLELSC